MTRNIGLLGALLLVLSAGAGAQAPDAFSGTWVLEIEGRNLLVLTLAAGRDGLEGTIQRPGAVNLTPVPQGIMIGGVQGAVFSAPVKELRAEPLGRVIGYEFPDGRSRTSLIRSEGENEISFAFDAANPELAPVTLVRGSASASVAADWDQSARYVVRNPVPQPNSEMAAIFVADQADRQGRNIDWSAVGERDEARRARVREMLDADLLHAPDDYYFAAFVFQHGSTPEDYLVAHALAMAAQAAGHPNAAWIAAATLDRFLHKVERPQIFGTQYTAEGEEPLTQGSYDAELIPDTLRRALGVSTREQQEAQRLEMESRRER